MRKALIPFVVSVGLIAIWASPANAASTRAEYIAQVDPICQSFVGPENAAAKAYHRNYKRMIHDASSGTLKRWVKQTRRTVGSLTRWDQIHSNMTEQIAAVPSPDADAGLISTWLDSRRRSYALANSAAAALNRFRVDRFWKLLGQSDKAEATGLRAIKGFGFQVCGYG